MIWKGKELKTIEDLMWYGIDQCESPEEAQEFMRQYRQENPDADSNVGYISGYYSSEEMERILQWFGVAHPKFGTKIPNAAETFYGLGFEAAVNILRKGNYSADDITNINQDLDGFGFTLKKSVVLKSVTNDSSGAYGIFNVLKAPIDQSIVRDVGILSAHILGDDTLKDIVEELLIEVIKDKSVREKVFKYGEVKIAIEEDNLVVTITQMLK
jgi:hypothetical protein